MEASKIKFTYESLSFFLCHLREISLIYRFCDHPPIQSGGFLMRHDIDLDLESADRLAEVEKSNEVRSTFFIMTTNEFYNPAAQHERRLLCKLVEEGFEIGLHFDPMVYGDSSASELQAAVDHEAGLLSRITGVPVQSVSLHNPGLSGVYTLFDGFLNAYDPAYFSQQKYISDSYMQVSFARNDLYQFVERGRERLCQILLHPCHFHDCEIGFTQILDRQNQRLRVRQDVTFASMLSLDIP